MKVSPFEIDAARPADRPEPRAEVVPVRVAGPPDETEDTRREEPLEEPGYGHGV